MDAPEVTKQAHGGRRRWPRRTGLAACLLALIAQIASAAPAAGTEETTEETAPPATRALASPRLAGRAPDPLFADPRGMTLRIEGPLRELLRDDREDPEELDATMSWRTPDGATGTLPIEYRARGKSRRKPEKCGFPPIRLDVPRRKAAGTIFEHQDKLKLVTHCKRLGSRSRDQYAWVWLEYYAYRVLNTLTDYSYRVRPMTVTWVDERGREYEHPAFVIEHDDRIAHRLGLEESERVTIDRDELVPEITALMDVFQYLLGNTDFSFVTAGDGGPCCHNAVQFTDGDGRYVPIPYDFDQIGLLDKPDAVPAPNLGIRSVTDRLYRGYCREERHLEAALELMRARRGELEAIFAEELPDIGKWPRRRAQRFLGKFWEVLDSPRRIEREFVRGCR